MPRNGSGTMSLANTISAGQPISASPVQANFSDIASEITGSLPRNGEAAMTGQLKASSGTVAAPGMAFSSDTDTGFYRKAADTIGIVSGGAEVGTIGTSGMTDANAVAIVGMPTGVILPYGATTAPTGWVRANGRTIGNASSGGTERANADTSTLFSFLWTNYGDSVCAVSSGRGASAAADYAANKTIALPDLRGRALFGLDDMGNSAASRLGTIITDETTNGASGGTETHTLTTAQLPVVTPAGTVAISDPGHAHAINVQSVQSGGGATGIGVSTTSNTVSAATGITATFSGTSFGSGAAHSNMPPAFLTTFIIKL